MSTDPPTLLLPDGSPFTTGVAEYFDTDPSEPALTEPRIYVRLHLVGFEILAMIDTAAPWCILEPTLGEAILPYVEELSGELRLSTRIGSISGRLYRGPATLVADAGEALEIEATFFLSPDWPAGNFIGYMGFLDRIRFATDAPANLVYFGHPG